MTPERLREIEGRFRANGVLSQAECEELLRQVRAFVDASTTLDGVAAAIEQGTNRRLIAAIRSQQR